MEFDGDKGYVPMPPNQYPRHIQEEQHNAICNTILQYLLDGKNTNGGLWFFVNISTAFPNIPVRTLDNVIFPRLLEDGLIRMLDGIDAPSSKRRAKFVISDRGKVFISKGGYAVAPSKTVKDFVFELLTRLDDSQTTIDVYDFVADFYQINRIDRSTIGLKMKELVSDGLITCIGHEHLTSYGGHASHQKPSIYASITREGEAYLEKLKDRRGSQQGLDLTGKETIDVDRNIANQPSYYYQVCVELKDPFLYAKLVGSLYELDIVDKNIVEDDIVTPYLVNKQFHVNGSVLTSNKVKKISIMRSTATIDQNINTEISVNQTAALYLEKTSIIFDEKYYQDVTREFFATVQRKIDDNTESAKLNTLASSMDKTSVFIVHGHDNEAKIEVARFIEKLGFKSIILHEQPNGGMTIIEKIETHTDVGFGIVLYTPCDEGAKKGIEGKLKPRARQNVILEHGYLMGKLKRNRVCALVKGNIELPTDISGIVYTEMDARNAWQIEVAKEMKAAGYAVDMNRL